MTQDTNNPNGLPRWGVVATIKAPARDILRFAAWHLDAGAHRVYVYLDAPTPDAAAALKAHPKCRVIHCDDAYWRKRDKTRPAAHQSRQTFNATRAYRRADVDWLAHFDVDEFLVAPTPLADELAKLPSDCPMLRIRPMELLADGDGTAFKDYVPPRQRDRLTNDIYPTYGEYLKGGFLSHLAGKVVIRTGLPALQLRIHNAFQDGVQITNNIECDKLRLAHLHATDWQSWQAKFKYRHAHGSYRANLSPTRSADQGGITLHHLFKMIEAEGGTRALQAFFQEVVADTPALRRRLEAHGLLYRADINADPLVTRHFPLAASI